MLPYVTVQSISSNLEWVQNMFCSEQETTNMCIEHVGCNICMLGKTVDCPSGGINGPVSKSGNLCATKYMEVFACPLLQIEISLIGRASKKDLGGQSSQLLF
jgi:hypothetical protein